MVMKWMEKPTPWARGRRAGSGGGGRFIGDGGLFDLGEGPTGHGADGIKACESLPATDPDIDELGLDLQAKTAATDLLGGEQGRSRSKECVENRLARQRAILDRISDKSHRLYFGCAARSSMRPFLKVLAPG